MSIIKCKEGNVIELTLFLTVRQLKIYHADEHGNMWLEDSFLFGIKNIIE